MMGELKITCTQEPKDSLTFDDVNKQLIVGVVIDGHSEDVFISAEDEEKLRVLLNERKESKE